MGPNIDSVILRNVPKCEKDVTWWNHNYFRNVRRDLEAKKRLLLLVEEEAMVSGNNSLVQNLKAEINILLDRESRMWNQRSRVLWLCKGDSNIKFFHSKGTKRF